MLFRSVDKRANEVSRDYYRAARDLDRKHNHSIDGECGPIEQRLRDYGQLGKVIGLAVGAFGECSDDTHKLMQFIANKMSHQLADGTLHNDSDFLSASKKSLIRKWGLTIHRGWARVLIDRIAILVNGVSGSSVFPHDLPDLVEQDAF